MQALWMVLASLIFAVMSVCVKFAAVHFSTFELVFYRGAIGTLLMAYVCQRKGISLLHSLLFFLGSRRIWRTCDAVHGHQRMGLDRSLAFAAHWHLGRIGPMVHDPRLQRWGHYGGR